MNLNKSRIGRHGLHYFGSTKGQMTDSYDHSNELLGWLVAQSISRSFSWPVVLFKWNASTMASLNTAERLLD
jgi:hypothetical protein